MPVTRRSLLRSLAALPLAQSLKAATAPVCSVTQPAPSSVFVLLAGPWLVFESAPNSPTLTALTVGTTLDDATIPFVHSCAVQTWFCQTKLAETVLPAGQQWSFEAANYDNSKPFATVMSNAFSNQNVAWVPTGCTSACQPGDRSVVVPVPTNMYFAGILKNATVSGPGVLKQDNVRPHVVTILEYASKGGSAPTVTLTAGPYAQPVTFTPGAHVVFVMRHTGNAPDELQHVRDAFGHLQRRMSKGSSLSYNIQTDTKYDLGQTDGFLPTEMGLDPAMAPGAASSKSTTFANCCGTGLLSGGGGGGG